MLPVAGALGALAALGAFGALGALAVLGALGAFGALAALGAFGALAARRLKEGDLASDLTALKVREKQFPVAVGAQQVVSRVKIFQVIFFRGEP